MRILYAAKHGKGENDNEGAIQHALRQLNHDVIAIHENQLRDRWQELKHAHSPDLLLFQNWKRPPDLTEVNYPKIFWYMDLVDFNDDSLRHLTRSRKMWMDAVVHNVHLGVCTDGDWVARDRTSRLIHLMQGADSRIAKPPTQPGEDIPLLFCGSVNHHPHQRQAFVKEMQDRYGDAFHWCRRRYGARLVNTIHRSSIVLAPDSPITDNYASNRAVITCSLGGFLLHPKCRIVESMYEDGQEAVFYKDREDLHDKISYYLSRPQERWRIQQAAYERTMDEHTYKHRLNYILHEADKRCVLNDRRTL